MAKKKPDAWPSVKNPGDNFRVTTTGPAGVGVNFTDRRGAAGDGAPRSTSYNLPIAGSAGSTKTKIKSGGGSPGDAPPSVSRTKPTEGADTRPSVGASKASQPIGDRAAGQRGTTASEASTNSTKKAGRGGDFAWAPWSRAYRERREGGRTDAMAGAHSSWLTTDQKFGGGNAAASSGGKGNSVRPPDLTPSQFGAGPKPSVRPPDRDAPRPTVRTQGNGKGRHMFDQKEF